MSIRRLNQKQVRNLSFRVIIKSRIMLNRACPANHWSFRRIPLINFSKRCFQVWTPKKYYVVTFSEFRRLSVYNVYPYLCRSFCVDTFRYSIRIPSASLINKSEIIL